MSEFLSAALDYAARGWPVFPCHATDAEGRCTCGKADCAHPGKHPHTEHGLRDATTDALVVRTWWSRWPDANVAIATGAAHLVVVDVDAKGGRPGPDNWAALAGELGSEIEDTAIAETPSGGFHIYYGANGHRVGNSTSLLAEGIDVRGEGGYVLAPPSRNGTEYVFAEGHGLERLRDLPPSLAKRLSFAKQRTRTQSGDGASEIPQGQRNATLASLAGTMRRRGMTSAEVLAALQAVNSKRCKPPLPEHEVCAIAESVGRYEPAADETPGDPLKPSHLTDSGNAERFIGYFGERVRYCAAEKAWRIFDGRRWATDETLHIEDLVGEALLTLYEEAARCPDDDGRRALARWALRSESAAARRAALECARSDRRVAVRPSDFDHDPYVINCLNGTVDLRSGELRPHNPADMITMLAPVVYDPEARSELWERVLLEACGGDDEYVAYLQRFYGYAASGETCEEIIAIQAGPTQTAKTTVNEAIKAALGDYAATVDPSTMTKQRYASPTRDDLLQLNGKRLAVSAEATRGAEFDVSLLKMFTGECTMKKRGLYTKDREFHPTAQLVLHTNDIPELPDDDDAIWRRVHMQPFTHRPAHIDTTFKPTLRNTAVSSPAILAWLIDGHIAWRERGLDPPKVVREASLALRISMNPLYDFFQQCCVFAPEAWTSGIALRSAYESWANENGVRRRISGKAWGKRLREHGCADEKRGDVRGWLGLGLNTHPDSEQDSRLEPEE